MVPHVSWSSWEEDLAKNGIRLMQIKNNLIDLIWNNNRPEPRSFAVRVHPTTFSGEKWQVKLHRLRKELSGLEVNATVITSLTEVAYLLNLRSFDIPYTPVFKVSSYYFRI